MIVRYYPSQEMNTIRRQMGTRPTTWTPAVRLVDMGDGYQLQVHLPGVEATDVDIQVSRRAVAIAGSLDATPTEERVLYDDQRYGSFRRVVYLPEAIQNQAVEADFSAGILTLQLPKAVKPSEKVVKVALTGQPAAEPAAPAAPEAVENTETDDVWTANA